MISRKKKCDTAGEKKEETTGSKTWRIRKGLGYRPK